MSLFDRLYNELSCPIDWNNHQSGPELTYWLNFLWYSTCHCHEVDQEASLFFSAVDCRFPDEPIYELEDSELERFIYNAKKWVVPARKCYKAFVNRFAHLQVATSAVYPKHYPPPNCQPDEILKLSKAGNASVLHPKAVPSLQEGITWNAIDDFVFQNMPDCLAIESFFSPKKVSKQFSALFEGKAMRISVWVRGTNIGASKGVFTEYAMIDFDFLKPHFHMYPVSKQEYDRADIQVDVAGWDNALL